MSVSGRALPSPWSRAVRIAGDGRDLALAGAVLAIVAMLILPLPGWLLDLGLALSITLSIVILMTALFIEKPLQLSSFPTMLLIATLLRLGLNIASTRLILAEGHTGAEAAGAMIAAFGELLMGGDAVIGMTIFLILVIINFIVITKGAGRIAEVAARFSLDAMPGKQMAIDADLNTGLIGESEARARRTEVEAESSFFGAMDGASKFVRGDAVAGLAITAVNLVVGLALGILSHGLSAGEAFHGYSVLTVGDGLVTQIPALIVSTAAGIVVSKAGVAGPAQTALVGELTRFPKALGVAATLMAVLALVPGLPFVPFAAAAGALGFAVWKLRRIAAGEVAQARATALAAEPPEPPIALTLAIDAMRIELGYALLPLLSAMSGEARLDDQVRALRRQLATEMGFVLPDVRIVDNLALPPESYLILVKDGEVARGTVRPGKLMALKALDAPPALPGETATEPVFGLPAVWIDRHSREEAAARGCTVVEAAAVVTTHLAEAIRDNLPDLLSHAAVQGLIDALPAEHRKLAADLVPARLPLPLLHRLLRALLAEQVSIRDLPTILEALAEALPAALPPAALVEAVRVRLGRQIAGGLAQGGVLPVVALAGRWDDRFDGGEPLSPVELGEFAAAAGALLDRLAAEGERPALLTTPGARPAVRALIERVRPQTPVLSHAELPPRLKLRTLATL